jgi:hypothetical protein
MPKARTGRSPQQMSARANALAAVAGIWDEQEYGTAPASVAVAIIPSDSTVLADPKPRALYIGVTGDVTVDMNGTGTNILFKAVPVGILPIKVSRVYSTGTTATNIVGLC